MHKFATICLAGALCFGFSGIRAEASSLSLAAEEGIASVMTEAQAAEVMKGGEVPSATFTLSMS